MNKMLFFAVITAIGAALLFASDALMDDFIISSSFCDYRNDHFHTGMDFAGEDRNLYALKDCELIFANIKRKGGINYGNGNFAVFESSDGRYRLNYSHLKENTLDIDKTKYTKGDFIAISGNTGYSTGHHLHFEIEDKFDNLIINPLNFIISEDTIKPSINDIYIKNGGVRMSLLTYANFNVKKNSRLYIDCYDRINGSKHLLMPHSITVYIDGAEASKTLFNSLKKINNQFVLDNGKEFLELYQNQTGGDYYLMEINSIPGTIGFKIVIEDFKGNQAVFTRPIKIVL